MTQPQTQWTPAEQAISQTLNQLKQNHPNQPTIRGISRDTGITYSRLRDILNQQHGAPTVSEILTLCHYFDITPTRLLQQAGIEPASQTTLENASDDQLLAETARRLKTRKPISLMTADEKADYVIAKYRRDPLTMAASTDPDKQNEMRGGDGR